MVATKRGWPGLRLVQQQLEYLKAFALPIIEEMAGWPASATWGEWLDRFAALAPRVLKSPAHVLRVLADLRPMGEVGPVDLDEARRVLAERLLTMESEPPAYRYGRVFVGTPEQARGRTFRVVFVPGLAERMFPQKPREDPIMLDGMREVVDPALPDTASAAGVGAAAPAAGGWRRFRSTPCVVPPHRAERIARARAVLLRAGRHARGDRTCPASRRARTARARGR